MVDPQIKSHSLAIIRQHTGRSHIHAHHKIPFLCLGLGQTLVQMGIFGSSFRIFQNVGGFAQLPQTHAQQCGRADGIAVRTAVGNDGVVIVGQQNGCGLRSRQILHPG